MHQPAHSLRQMFHQPSHLRGELHITRIIALICALIGALLSIGCNEPTLPPAAATTNNASTSNTTASYFAYKTNGDKAAFGIRLHLKDGAITSGTILVLAPDYPANKECQEAPIEHLTTADNQTTFEFTLQNGGKPETFHWTIVITAQDEKTIHLLVGETHSDNPPTHALDLTRDP